MSTSSTGWLVVLLLHHNHHEMLDQFQIVGRVAFVSLPFKTIGLAGCFL
jgi:hypothetical protein